VAYSLRGLIQNKLQCFFMDYAEVQSGNPMGILIPSGGGAQNGLRGHRQSGGFGGVGGRG
jgi:hypothetical protein